MFIPRATPSPNQPSFMASISDGGSESQRDDWLSSDQIRFFTDKLQAQQWLGPANIPWVILRHSS
jgi:hypothetical protein